MAEHMTHTQESIENPQAVAEATVKRISFLASDQTHREIVRLSKAANTTLTGLIKLGLGFAQIAIEARQNGQKLVVVGSDGNPCKELVLPLP